MNHPKSMFQLSGVHYGTRGTELEVVALHPESAGLYALNLSPKPSGFTYTLHCSSFLGLVFRA